MRTSRPGWRPARGLAIWLLAGVLGSMISGCGPAERRGEPPPPSLRSGPPPEATRNLLAARAAAAKDRIAITTYLLASPDRPDRVITVIRAEDGGWRVDVPGGALDGTADVTILRSDDQLYHCGAPRPAELAGCVAVPEIPAEADPRVQHLFSDWLEVFTDRSAAVAVTSVPPPEPLTGDCFAVQPSAASLVAVIDGGVYCYQEDGTLTGAVLALGTLTLRDSDPAAPESVTLPGPIIAGEPLPTAAPTPTGSPSPSPDATPAG